MKYTFFAVIFWVFPSSFSSTTSLFVEVALLVVTFTDEIKPRRLSQIRES